MKVKIIILINCFIALLARAQVKQDSAGASSKERFYKSYSEYLEKNKRQKPKITPDSSVLYAPGTSVVKDSAKHFTKTAGTHSTEIKGTLSGTKNTVLIIPGKPVVADSSNVQKKNIPAVSAVVQPAKQAVQHNASSNTVTRKKLNEYLAMQQRQSSKITPDSSVHFASSKPVSKVPTVKTDKHGQLISGTIAPNKQHRGTIIEPLAPLLEVKTDKVETAENIKPQQHYTKPVLRVEPQAKNPSETLDTTVIGAKKIIEKATTNAHAQEIKGIILPDKNAAKIIAPSTADAGHSQDNNKKESAVKKSVNTNATLETAKTKDPLSVYSVPSAEEAYKPSTPTTDVPSSTVSTSSYYVEGDSKTNQTPVKEETGDDPLRKYAAQNVKASYKSQVLSQEMIAQRKNPKILEPISIDSIARKMREDSMMAVMADSIRKMNEEAMRSIEDERNAEMAAALKDQSQNTRYNFYLIKNGQFSVSFSNDKFYLNVNQRGKIVDFAILTNGSVTAGNLQNKVTQVGNAKIVYNYRGNIDSIAGIQVTYTYDGKVNKVGNSFITYNYEGVIEKVGEIPIIYNGNGTVFRFGNFSVAYNNQGVVAGIDDSNGLVIYRPMSDK